MSCGSALPQESAVTTHSEQLEKQGRVLLPAGHQSHKCSSFLTASSLLARACLFLHSLAGCHLSSESLANWPVGDPRGSRLSPSTCLHDHCHLQIVVRTKASACIQENLGSGVGPSLTGGSRFSGSRSPSDCPYCMICLVSARCLAKALVFAGG